MTKLEEQINQLKRRCEALELALETEHAAANLYARQVAHWMHKYNELLKAGKA